MSLSFINKSVNYSQTVLLKSKLAAALCSYNDHILSQGDNASVTDVDSAMSYYVIPNNGQKYYMYTMKKKALENTSDNYNIVYFFPDAQTEQAASDVKTQRFAVSDFCLEMNGLFGKEYLFEGYMYKGEGDAFQHFMITDLLVEGGTVVQVDYALRHALCHEIVHSNMQNLKIINNHMTIGIHPVFRCGIDTSESMVEIFKNNFMYKDSLKAIERVKNFDKALTVYNKHSTEVQRKRLRRGRYADVYEVFDVSDGNRQGILYVKGVRESKLLKAKFEVEDTVTLDCRYNSTFNKWEPVAMQEIEKTNRNRCTAVNTYEPLAALSRSVS